MTLCFPVVTSIAQHYRTLPYKPPTQDIFELHGVRGFSCGVQISPSRSQVDLRDRRLDFIPDPEVRSRFRGLFFGCILQISRATRDYC